jgi:hypothetical protein
MFSPSRNGGADNWGREAPGRGWELEELQGAIYHTVDLKQCKIHKYALNPFPHCTFDVAHLTAEL